MRRLAYKGSLRGASLADFLQEKHLAAQDEHRSYPPFSLVQMSTASIQFLMLNARLQCCQGTEGWGIDRKQVDLGPSPFAQKGLHAVIVDRELAPKREGVLLDLARTTIKHEDIVARRTGASCQAARAIQEGSDQDLPVLIPALHSVVTGELQRSIKSEKRALVCPSIVEHDAQRRQVNKSEPRPYFLRQLLDALPQYRDRLLPLMEKEFPGVSEMVEEALPQEIASSFYTHVLETYVATPLSLRFWSICPLILQHLLDHLDPEQHGLQLLVVRCMPPWDQDQKIHSLREYVAVGTPPWQTDLEERHLFLGAESLAGYAVSSCHPAVIQNLQQDPSFLPAQEEEHERSAAAFPLMLASRVAGCLLVSSTQPQYFHRQRVAILKQYTHLLVLAFQTEEFSDPAAIELKMMPSQRIQQSYFATFRQRVSDVLAQAQARQQSLTSQQAEQVAWQQLEEELLQIPL